jgi:diadenylate cyclase
LGVLDRIQSLQNRLLTYQWWEVAVEFAVIWLVVWLVVRFVQGTRAAGALKGLLVILIVLTVMSRLFGGDGSFQRLGLLYDKFLALVAVALVVIFQPELRRALVRLGETSFLRATPKDIRVIVEEVADAAEYLSRAKFGALIVIERQTKLTGLVEGGTKMGAELSSRLLQAIFFPGAALHDLAVIVRGRVIDAAGVQLPLADPQDMPDARLGSRHRAAVGLSQECDALVVVVSEETGNVRIAERGKLTKPLSDEQLRELLTMRLTSTIDRRRVGGGVPPPPSVPDVPTAAERHDSAMLEGPGGESIAGETVMGETLAGASLSGESVAGEGTSDSGLRDGLGDAGLGETGLNDATNGGSGVAQGSSDSTASGVASMGGEDARRRA